jgi:hypothetical protein
MEGIVMLRDSLPLVVPAIPWTEKVPVPVTLH